MIKCNSVLIRKIVITEDFSLNEIFERRGRIYTFLNPVSYLLALENKEIFGSFNGIFADGSILVSAIRLLYSKRITRRSFDMTSIVPKLLDYVIENDKTIYIVASKQEAVERAVEIIRECYPAVKIIGYRNGYFSSEKEMRMEAEHIVELNPDFLIVGMGVLMQEDFLFRVKKNGYLGVGFTCGGFIHQTFKSEINYYPKWVDKINMRFVYRMYKEKHTRKRYLLAAFLFPLRFIGERFFWQRYNKLLCHQNEK